MGTRAANDMFVSLIFEHCVGLPAQILWLDQLLQLWSNYNIDRTTFTNSIGQVKVLL